VNGVVRASADSFAIPQHTTKEPVLVTWVSDGGTEDTRDDRKRSDPIPADRKTERDEAAPDDREQHHWERCGLTNPLEQRSAVVAFDRDEVSSALPRDHRRKDLEEQLWGLMDGGDRHRDGQ